MAHSTWISRLSYRSLRSSCIHGLCRRDRFSAQHVDSGANIQQLVSLVDCGTNQLTNLCNLEVDRKSETFFVEFF
jgi:hypothetical protein